MERQATLEVNRATPTFGPKRRAPVPIGTIPSEMFEQRRQRGGAQANEIPGTSRLVGPKSGRTSSKAVWEPRAEQTWVTGGIRQFIK